MSPVEKVFDISNRAKRYGQRYGAILGASILARVVLGHGPGWFPLPKLRGQMLLRRHTSDIAAFEQVFIDREYDFPLADIDPKFIIDGGANVGCASVFFAHKFPQASIWAFEPENSNYEILEQNGRRFGNVTTMKAAIWNSDTHVEIQNPGDEQWAFRVQETASSGCAQIQALSIPSIMKMAGTDRVDILKLDIEGAERDLFDEYTEEWIGKVGIIIVELHDWIRPGCSDALAIATKGLSWERSRFGENTVLIRR